MNAAPQFDEGNGSRRSALRRLVVLAAAPATAGLSGLARSAGEPREIAVTASRFMYRPNEIPVRLGEKIVLAFTSLDFVHGFFIPSMNIRADLVPGKITRVEVVASTPGSIEFRCDNFCGDGHEQMSGHLVVSAG